MKYLFAFHRFILCSVVYLSACSFVVAETPKNIIFLIGDGMGLAQVTNYMYQYPDSNSFSKFTHTGLIKTHAHDGRITDSAASATAYACGQKTLNGYIGMTHDKKKLSNIAEKASEKGMLTGLIATCVITHATPAAFYAHNISRKNHEAIAKDLVNSNIDIVIGGGKKYFVNRKDGLNLFALAESKAYHIVFDYEEFESTKFFQKTIALLEDGHLPKKSEGRQDILRMGFEKTINYFEIQKKNFFIMIEGSQIDWGGHANDTEYVLNETRDFDKAIQAALHYAEKRGDTLVIVTADHETGGMTLVNNNTDKTNPKAISKYSTKGHSGVMVPIFAFGPGAESFTGIMDNTDVFKKIVQLLNL